MRSLILLLALVPFVLHAQTSLPPSLRDRANDALGRRQLDSAELLLGQWLEADPRDESSWYNMACILALEGKNDRALDAFENAVTAGWDDAEQARVDDDLESIRDADRFGKALRAIEERGKANGPKGYIRHFVPMTSRGTYVAMLPPDYETSSRTYPLCVILHGSGSTELAHGRLADGLGRDDVIYIAVRAPFASIERIRGDGQPGYTSWPNDRIPDEDSADIRAIYDDYVNLIFSSVDDATKRYRVRPGKVWIVGHSQGGQFANLCGILHPERVAGVLSIAGSSVRDWFLTAENFARMKKEGIVYRVIHGDSDPVVPKSTSILLEEKLRLGGVQVRLDIVPGQHTISPALMAEAKKWKEEIK